MLGESGMMKDNMWPLAVVQKLKRFSGTRLGRRNQFTLGRCSSPHPLLFLENEVQSAIVWHVQTQSMIEFVEA